MKRVAQALSLVIVFPSAVLCVFGRAGNIFMFFAQAYSLIPGLVGVIIRAAFYKLTLRSCSLDCAIALGTYFSSREVDVGKDVWIGSFCVIGRARIGERTQISGHVEIPSGRHQHRRDGEGYFLGFESNEVVIGRYCWIGAGAVVMANVGDHTTIGAGAVVVHDIPDRVIAVGVPAKPVKSSLASGVGRELATLEPKKPLLRRRRVAPS